MLTTKEFLKKILHSIELNVEQFCHRDMKISDVIKLLELSVKLDQLDKKKSYINNNKLLSKKDLNILRNYLADK